MMRILFIDKTAVLGSSRERYEKFSRLTDVETAVLSPNRWYEHMRWVRAEEKECSSYRRYFGKTFWTGSYSRGFYVTGLRNALEDFQPDVIQLLEEPWSFFAGQTVRQARKSVPGAKILFYTWENIYRQGTYCSRLDSIHRRIEAAVFSTAVSGICATETAAEVLRKRGYPGPTPVIPYGVSEEFFLTEKELENRLNQPPGQPPRVGYVGRLLPMKGVDLLIQALRTTKVHLTILGEGDAENSLKKMAQEAGVSDRVTWIRAVPPGQVVKHMRNLDILVLPSRTTPTWAEQLGRVMLEAMASGVAVIGSTSGSIPEVIGNAGLVFREGDSEALASSIQTLNDDENLWKKLIRSGWERVRSRYTWDRFVADLSAHCEELLSKGFSEEKDGRSS